MNIQEINIDDLIPYHNNPRKNQAIEKVADSIKEFGFQQPIVVDKNMVVIVGHTRLLGAKKLGLGKVPIVIADLSDAKAKAYRIADNRVNEDSAWDNQLLQEELNKLLDFDVDLNITGFTNDELDSATAFDGTTFTAGDGLDLTTGTLSTDLKSNGGLVIESNELAVDLAASSITGTLAIGDGGTGSTSTTYCALGSNVSGTLPVANGGTGATSLTADGVLFGNGTSAISAVDLSTNGNIIVGGASPAAVTGANLAGSGLAATTGNGTLVLDVETLNQDTTGTAAIATTVTAADESSDTTCFPLFATAATGNVAPKTGTNLAFNSSTGDLTVGGRIEAKTYNYISCGFFDSMGTTKHYLPLNGAPSEQATDSNSYTDWLAPCHTTVLSAQVKITSIISSGGDITLEVEKDAIGSSSSSSVESETVSVSASNDLDVAHFLFDNATVDKGENMKISIQATGGMTSSNIYVIVVLLHDWSDRYTASSQVFTS